MILRGVGGGKVTQTPKSPLPPPLDANAKPNRVSSFKSDALQKPA